MGRATGSVGIAGYIESYKEVNKTDYILTLSSVTLFKWLFETRKLKELLATMHHMTS